MARLATAAPGSPAKTTWRRTIMRDLAPGAPGEAVTPIAEVTLTPRARLTVEWVVFPSGPPALRLWRFADGAPRGGLVIPMHAVASVADAIQTAVPLACQAQREEDRTHAFRHR